LESALTTSRSTSSLIAASWPFSAVRAGFVGGVAAGENEAVVAVGEIGQHLAEHVVESVGEFHFLELDDEGQVLDFLGVCDNFNTFVVLLAPAAIATSSDFLLSVYGTHDLNVPDLWYYTGSRRFLAEDLGQQGQSCNINSPLQRCVIKQWTVMLFEHWGI